MGEGGRVRVEAYAPADARMQLDDALPKNDFLRALQREKRRSDRSRAPLSMALYRLNDEAPVGSGSSRQLARILHGSKRETDILSHLGDDLIAVLFPDTNEAGLRRFLDKIEAQAGTVSYSTISATYPDCLFENLEHGILALQTAHDAAADETDAAREEGYLLKRPLDILGAVLALVLLSPLMLVTALAVKLTSPGPIIFKQHRLGKGGVPFVFYKFRSMASNADDRIHREFVENLIKGAGSAGGAPGTVYKMTADPRITRVGHLIRKTSIDELPQLFNVLKGDMSLVGPRPPLPYEAECYESWHLRRVLDLRPGLTGLWQVDGRSKVGFDDMVRMDLRYIRTCSLWLDLKILLKTVAVVLRCDGAV